jgi:hypothetical protein
MSSDDDMSQDALLNGKIAARWGRSLTVSRRLLNGHIYDINCTVGQSLWAGIDYTPETNLETK